MQVYKKFKTTHYSLCVVYYCSCVDVARVQFVAHANCQQLLASLWFEGLPGFRRRHILSQLMLAVGICVSFPILSILYIVLPCSSSVSHFMRRPFIKFLIHASSFLSFVCALLLLSNSQFEMCTTRPSNVLTAHKCFFGRTSLY